MKELLKSQRHAWTKEPRPLKVLNNAPARLAPPRAWPTTTQEETMGKVSVLHPATPPPNDALRTCAEPSRHHLASAALGSAGACLLKNSSGS